MGLEESIDEITEKISRSVPNVEKEYLAEDGLLHCAKCHEKTETVVEFLGKKKKVRCICDCKRKEIEARDEKERAEERERERRVCFAETNMSAWTFANDDRKNPKISDAMKKYADNFADFRKTGRGLVLYGTVGTGKTYLAACIANELLDKGYTVLMTNFARLTNQIQSSFSGRNEYIDSLNKYSMLVIDDLGAERDSEYMQEMIFNIIDSRYRAGLPFIVTTNLTAKELSAPKDIGRQRIYDRILERCYPVEVLGGSRRRNALLNNFEAMKGELGL